MYNRIYFDKFKNTMHLWDDKSGYSNFEYKPYAYILDQNGDKMTMTGIPVKKTTMWNSTAEELGMVFESDVQPEMRTLIDLYGDSDDISENLIMYFDIEVRKNGKYSNVEDASNEINAISFVTNQDNNYKILLLDEDSETKKYGKRIKVVGTDVEVVCEVETYTSEIQLLKSFLKYLRKFDPSIITGWHTDFFDIPYMYNRIEKILGRDYSNMLSPINVVKKSNYMGKSELVIAGLYNLDYLNLYKKFTYSEEPSYQLDAIAKKELGIGKIEYEGSLDDLWREDPDKFISYSVIDTWLVKSMDSKLDYIDIACGICHKGHVPYSDIAFTSKYLEGALLTHLYRQNLVAVRSEKSKDTSKAEGAYVKEPNPGVYRWIYDLDLTSLYPWNIISLNISPETKFGHVYQWDQKAYLSKSLNDDRPWIILKKGDKVTQNFFEDLDEINENEIRFSSTAELKQYLIDNNKSISSAGIIYNLDKIGLIPEVLKKWFSERTEYSNLMKEYGLKGDSEKERYYDKKQLVTKILLNSLYGVLLLPTFRFYDKQNGESVTVSGKTVIKWATAMADQFYMKELKEFNKDCEIEFEDGTLRIFHGFDHVKTVEGIKYVFQLTENDELI